MKIIWKAIITYISVLISAFFVLLYQHICLGLKPLLVVSIYCQKTMANLTRLLDNKINYHPDSTYAGGRGQGHVLMIGKYCYKCWLIM